MLELFYAVPSSGRILVPINFRLRPSEVDYIVEHSAARRCCWSIPRSTRSLERGHGEAPASCSARRATSALLRFDREPEPWSDIDEDATATINYTSGTTARPKGVQITHRNIWVNAVTFGLHAGVTRLGHLPAHAADVPRQRLGHALHRGRPRRDRRSCCARSTAPRSCAGSSGTASPSCARRLRWSTRSSTRLSGWQGRVPGGDRVTRVICAGAPPPSKTIERIEDELGWEFCQIYGLTETSPLLTINRRRREQAGVAGHRGLARSSAGLERRRSASSSRSATPARCWPGPTSSSRATGTQPEATADALDGGWFHTGDGGYIDDEGYPHDLRPQEGRDHHRRRERVVDRGRGLSLLRRRRGRVRGHRRTGREVGRDDQGDRRPDPWLGGDRGDS